MLASIGVPLAIEAIEGAVWERNAHTSPPPYLASRARRSPGTGGRGMHVNPYWAQLQPPPPFFGTWRKKVMFKDVPLSNIDLLQRCD